MSLLYRLRRQTAALSQQMGATAALALVAKEQSDRTKDLAEQMRDSVQQATRLASATEKANANVVASDRP